MLALEGAEGVGLGAGDGLDATGGRAAEEDKSNSRVNSNYLLYILVSDNARREITYQEMVSERWEEVLAAVLVCLLGEEA